MNLKIEIESIYKRSRTQIGIVQAECCNLQILTKIERVAT